MIHLARLLAEAIPFTQLLLGAQTFIQWQRLNAEPGTPLLANRSLVGHRAIRCAIGTV
ncbi:hypothetical protein L3V59_36095 [Burkholderia aenigmatica]|nr:hypothetical protein [Burkholderia aenigmatica]UKD17842.1 hypothetical protein L3V59_36095 [Burkholderia aenigmatica]